MARSNDLASVRGIITRLQDAGVKEWIFGGWAEELLGRQPPRQLLGLLRNR